MKNRSFLEKLRYRIDRFMSRGPIAMSILLLSATSAVVLLIGLLSWLCADEGGFLYNLWVSLMHTLDAGNLSGTATDNIPYLIMMSLATLCGLFLTSILIGIIATGVESKLQALRKGTSRVIESGHTVIIGFDGNIYSLLSELIEANANQKDACIVILGEEDKTVMEDTIADHFPDSKTTRIICRSGGLHEQHALARCSLESCRSVILNINDDAQTIKTILSISTYIKNTPPTFKDMRIVSYIQENQYMEAANIAGDGRATVIYAKDAIARIIANTCRQHGLSQVLTELFNFGGNEFYFESVPSLVGKTMGDALLSFSNAVPVAICRNGQVRLNPPMDTVILEGDQLALLEEDDGAYVVHEPKSVPVAACHRQFADDPRANHLVILGSNDKLPIILKEYDLYVSEQTSITIVDDDFRESSLATYKNLQIHICTEPVNRALLCRLLENANNILLLNDDSADAEASDSQTLLRLILLRDIADSSNKHFSITTEMRSVDNQRLATQARVDDFVIGSNFACLLMAQISEDPLMTPLITDLLDEDGSELYIKPVCNYIDPGVQTDMYTLTQCAARQGEIFIGYRLAGRGDASIVVNPAKDTKVTFTEQDKIVVIAEN